MKLLFYSRLLRRGYPVKVIRKSFATVSFETRDDFLIPKAPPITPLQRIPLVLTLVLQANRRCWHRCIFRESLAMPLLQRHAIFALLIFKFVGALLPN